MAAGIGEIAAAWLALWAAYLLFAGGLGADEVATGAAAAGLSTLWWRLAGRRGGLRFPVDSGALAALARAVIALPGETGRVGLRLARVLGGGPGGAVAGEPASAADWAGAGASPTARALGLAAESLSPAGYVLRLDPARGEVMRHALDPRDLEGAA